MGWDRYKHTLIFAALIVCATAGYILFYIPSVPSNESCMPNLALSLTAPFNISCEGNPLAIGTLEGFAHFFDNFFLPLIFIGLVETVTGAKVKAYRRNIFLAAIFATYLVVFTLGIHSLGTASGTSIVGFSMVIFLIYWLANEAIQKFRVIRSIKPVEFVIPFGFTFFFVALAWYVYLDVSQIPLTEIVLHLMGGVFFILLLTLLTLITKPEFHEQIEKLIRIR